MDNTGVVGGRGLVGFGPGNQRGEPSGMVVVARREKVWSDFGGGGEYVLGRRADSQGLWNVFSPKQPDGFFVGGDGILGGKVEENRTVLAGGSSDDGELGGNIGRKSDRMVVVVGVGWMDVGEESTNRKEEVGFGTGGSRGGASSRGWVSGTLHLAVAGGRMGQGKLEQEAGVDGLWSTDVAGKLVAGSGGE